MIVRGQKPNKNFTVIENAILRDSTLSYRARGVLVSILSRPENWTTTVKNLQGPNTEGRDAIETALRELRDAGYMVLTKSQDDGGKWSSTWIVYDSPQPIPENPGSENRSLENRSLENRRSENQGLIEEPSTKTVEERVVANAPTLESDPGFADFWLLYPKKVGKAAALVAFNRAAKEVGAETIIDGLKRLLPSIKANDSKFIKHPSTWLNAGCWDDEIDPKYVQSLKGNAQLGQNHLGYEIDDMKSGELAERLGARMIT